MVLLPPPSQQPGPDQVLVYSTLPQLSGKLQLVESLLLHAPAVASVAVFRLRERSTSDARFWVKLVGPPKQRQSVRCLVTQAIAPFVVRQIFSSSSQLLPVGMGPQGVASALFGFVHCPEIQRSSVQALPSLH